MAELKRCPFCGGEAKLKPFKSGIFSKSVYYVACRRCGCQTAVQLEEAEAVEAWNRDALPSADAVEVVRCKECRDGGHCEVESLLREIEKIDNPYCAGGKRRAAPNA